MTRAQIANAGLVAKLRRGHPEQVRPCLLCNQACRVRDPRNPLVSCVGDPRSGHETEDPPEEGRDPRSRDVLVVGGGPAAGSGPDPGRPGPPGAAGRARRAHRRGAAHRGPRPGPGTAGPAPGLAGGRVPPAGRAHRHRHRDRRGRPGRGPGRRHRGAARDWVPARGPPGRSDPAALDPLAVLSAGPGSLPDGPVVVDDPVGGPAGVAMAEWLAAGGRTVTLVTPDPVAGTLLSLTGDLADANARLQRAGVTRALRSRLRRAAQGRAWLEDAWTGEQREIGCAAVIDCGHRLADTALYEAARSEAAPHEAAQSAGPGRPGQPGVPRAGDCVAPRTAAEAVLEGRRRARRSAPRGGPAPRRPAPTPAPWNASSRPRPPRRRTDSPPRVSRRLAAGRPRRLTSRNENHVGARAPRGRGGHRRPPAFAGSTNNTTRGSDRSGRKARGQSGLHHRRRPGPGPQPRHPAGPGGRQHHRGGPLPRDRLGGLPDGHPGRPGRDGQGGRGPRPGDPGPRGRRPGPHRDEAAVRRGVARFGRLDIVLANAGITPALGVDPTRRGARNRRQPDRRVQHGRAGHPLHDRARPGRRDRADQLDRGDQRHRRGDPRRPATPPPSTASSA